MSPSPSNPNSSGILVHNDKYKWHLKHIESTAKVEKCKYFFLNVKNKKQNMSNRFVFLSDIVKKLVILMKNIDPDMKYKEYVQCTDIITLEDWSVLWNVDTMGPTS